MNVSTNKAQNLSVNTTYTQYQAYPFQSACQSHILNVRGEKEKFYKLINKLKDFLNDGCGNILYLLKIVRILYVYVWIEIWSSLHVMSISYWTYLKQNYLKILLRKSIFNINKSLIIATNKKTNSHIWFVGTLLDVQHRYRSLHILNNDNYRVSGLGL